MNVCYSLKKIIGSIKYIILYVCKILFINNLAVKYLVFSEERGILTLGSIATTHAFQAC